MNPKAGFELAVIRVVNKVPKTLVIKILSEKKRVRPGDWFKERS